MAEGRADEHSVEGHLGNARAEVVAVLADIVRNPRGQQLLQTGEDTGCEHLRAQRVLLEVEEVGLVGSIGISRGSSKGNGKWEWEWGSYLKVAVCTRGLASSQTVTQTMRQVARRSPDGLIALRYSRNFLLEFDRHCGPGVWEVER